MVSDLPNDPCLDSQLTGLDVSLTFAASIFVRLSITCVMAAEVCSSESV